MSYASVLKKNLDTPFDKRKVDKSTKSKTRDTILSVFDKKTGEYICPNDCGYTCSFCAQYCERCNYSTPRLSPQQKAFVDPETRRWLPEMYCKSCGFLCVDM